MPLLLPDDSVQSKERAKLACDANVCLSNVCVRGCGDQSFLSLEVTPW